MLTQMADRDHFGSTVPLMELIIIRHGRPARVENAEGAADPELTDIGHQQAKAMADWVRAESLDRIYVSSMVRARQTSAPLEEAFGMEAIVDDGVREFDDDADHYIPVEEMKKDKEAWRAFLKESVNETRDVFNNTVVTAIQAIVDDNKGKKVAIVCHGGVINAWASDVLGLDGSMFFNPNYTSLNRFMCASSGERSVLSLNDVGHLRDKPELYLYH